MALGFKSSMVSNCKSLAAAKDVMTDEQHGLIYSFKIHSLEQKDYQELPKNKNKRTGVYCLLHF